MIKLLKFKSFDGVDLALDPRPGGIALERMRTATVHEPGVTRIYTTAGTFAVLGDFDRVAKNINNALTYHGYEE